MPKSIVFGANGYIGRHLVYSLMEKEHEVLSVGVEDKSLDDVANYVQVDVTDKSQIESISFDVDYIFVFAGLIGTKNGFDKYEAFVNVNVIGLLNILDHIVKTKSKATLIFPSTRLVYKGKKDAFLVENDEKECKTIYAQNKLSCEGILEMYSNFYDVKYLVFRICVVYGNRFDDNYSYGTIGFFLSKAMKGEDIVLYGSGEPKRTFTHVEDITNIILISINERDMLNQIFNIGSLNNSDLNEVAKMIANKFGVGVKYTEWPMEAAKLESGDTMFADTKMQANLQYKYQNNLESWLNRIS